MDWIEAEFAYSRQPVFGIPHDIVAVKELLMDIAKHSKDIAKINRRKDWKSSCHGRILAIWSRFVAHEIGARKAGRYYFSPIVQATLKWLDRV